MINMRPAVKWIACICLLLTLGSAISFAAHMHMDAADEAHCMVCVAAHTSSPTAIAILLLISTLIVSALALPPVAAAKQRLSVFALSVRPPPQPRLS